ncbi:MAG: hypothetical protein ABIR24_03310 [Verrucomicrobiota bacterium]
MSEPVTNSGAASQPISIRNQAPLIPAANDHGFGIARHAARNHALCAAVPCFNENPLRSGSPLGLRTQSKIPCWIAALAVE